MDGNDRPVFLADTKPSGWFVVVVVMVVVAAVVHKFIFCYLTQRSVYGSHKTQSFTTTG